jgi:hypothetical protein
MYKQQSQTLRDKVLLVKNKKRADCTITHPCGVVKGKNILAETGYRYIKYTA